MTVPPDWIEGDDIFEAMHVDSYIDLLGPDHAVGPGKVWLWVTGHGGHIEPHQVDPGPAYGILQTPEGPLRIDVWDWIIRGPRGHWYIHRLAKTKMFTLLPTAEELAQPDPEK